MPISSPSMGLILYSAPLVLRPLSPAWFPLFCLSPCGFCAFLFDGSHCYYPTVLRGSQLLWISPWCPFSGFFGSVRDICDIAIIYTCLHIILASFSAYFASTCNTKTLKFQFYAGDIPHDVPNTPKIPISHVPRSYLDINCSIPRVAARFTFVPFLIRECHISPL